MKPGIVSFFYLLLTQICLSQPIQNLPSCEVKFQTSDARLQQLYDQAEILAKQNIITYGDRQVLKEGAKYVSVWLETQPMGGYMYAKRNMQVAKNNIEIFMDYQREDGRLPGVIYNKEGVDPNYVQFQGLYFAMPAFEMYYLLGKDREYLTRVYESLKAFDQYLWKIRDSDGNGCLETWCIYDNGEDHSVRLGDFPNGWYFDYPPSPEAAAKLTPEELRIYVKEDSYDPLIDTMNVPIESMDVMSYSYACRDALAKIAEELNNGEVREWQAKAEEVQQKIKSYLWNAERQACFDKDKNNETMPILLHNNLRCMHLGSFDQEMAEGFIREHLMNKAEFWTPMPLPSVAANDPAFRNIAGNNWSGQPQGLTYQRSIRALENYGHYAELTLIGQKFIDVLKDSLKFTQQFDPFTATINNSKDGYGPSILACLEFIGRFYGVHITQDKVYWSCLEDSEDYEYSQLWNDQGFTLKTKGDKVICTINGEEKFRFTRGARVITDLSGNLLEVVGIDTETKDFQINADRKYSLTLAPNSIYRKATKKKFTLLASRDFYQPWE